MQSVTWNLWSKEEGASEKFTQGIVYCTFFAAGAAFEETELDPKPIANLLGLHKETKGNLSRIHKFVKKQPPSQKHNLDFL
jgi:hypothetical protein